MSDTAVKTYETIVPTKTEAALAEQTIKVLMPYMKSTKHPMFELLAKGRKAKQITYLIQHYACLWTF